MAQGINAETRAQSDGAGGFHIGIARRRHENWPGGGTERRDASAIRGGSRRLLSARIRGKNNTRAPVSRLAASWSSRGSSDGSETSPTSGTRQVEALPRQGSEQRSMAADFKLGQARFGRRPLRAASP